MTDDHSAARDELIERCTIAAYNFRRNRTLSLAWENRDANTQRRYREIVTAAIDEYERSRDPAAGRVCVSVETATFAAEWIEESLNTARPIRLAGDYRSEAERAIADLRCTEATTG